jgi:tetratricopeptide (TPR) repeat protein
VRLTAALIVRDESRFIEGCLESLVGRVDEIVLVDTGSRDDTIAKALQFPIKLYQFDWCDDFSAARNFALEQATGNWILYIDADERFAIPQREMLGRVLGDDSKVAWRLRLHPRIDWTAYAELRLFRNDPRIRFRGAIHERVHDSVDVVVRSDKMEIGDCELVLQHVGYEDDQARKNPRNIPLLRARLAGDPKHLYSWWHLGQCLQLAGDAEGAVAAWSNGIAVARQVPATARDISAAQCIESLLKLQIGRGIDVTGLLREARALYPNHLSLQWIEATWALERGDNESARAPLEMLAAIDPEQFFDPRVAYHKAIFRHLAKEALALCWFRQGCFDKAARLYHLAAQHSPDRQGCEVKARLAELRGRNVQPS